MPAITWAFSFSLYSEDNGSTLALPFPEITSPRMARPIKSLASITAGRTFLPEASPAVIADEKTQPVPCGSDSESLSELKISRPLLSRNRSSGFPFRCPPVITTARTPNLRIFRAARFLSAGRRILIPDSISASLILGVTR